MKKDFSYKQMKGLLIEIKNLMEVVSVNERHSNELLMKKYESLFIESLFYFNPEEVWRN